MALNWGSRSKVSLDQEDLIDVFTNGSTTPGKRTVSSQLPPRSPNASIPVRNPIIQRKETATSAIQAAVDMAFSGRVNSTQIQAKSDNAIKDGKHSVQEIAQSGFSGSAKKLPFIETVQKAFGNHDISGVQAHLGSEAKDASNAMGAEAYASGQSVAFRDSSPTLHTVAHEAAHIVQQRAGVSLKGGVGQAGDKYEQHADAVADLVVQGKSAEGILNQMAGSNSKSSHSIVQRKGNDVEFEADEIKGSTDKGEQKRNSQQVISDNDKSLSNAEKRGKDIVKNRDGRAEIVRSLSAKMDKSEIEKYIQQIDSAQPQLKAAAGWEASEYYFAGSKGPQFAQKAKENKKTRNSLVSLQNLTDDASGHTDTFRGYFDAARTDYVALVAMSGQALSLAGVAQGSMPNTDSGKIGHVASAFETSKNQIKGAENYADREHFSDKLGGSEGDQQPLKERSEFKSFQDSRKQLATIVRNTKKHYTTVNTATSDYRSALAKSAAKVATGAKEKSAGKVAKIQQEINQAASRAGKVVGLASSIVGGIGNPGNIADNAAAVIKNQAGATIKDVIGADPASVAENLTKELLEYVNADKVAKLSLDVNWYEDEAKYQSAVASKQAVISKTSAFQGAVKEFVRLVNDFFQRRKTHEELTQALVVRATKDNNGAAAMAIRFLGRADTFLSGAELSITAGKEQLSKARDAVKKRLDVGAAGPSQGNNAVFYEASKQKDNDGDAFYRSMRYEVKFASAGEGSLASGLDGSGATEVISLAIGDLEKWVNQIKNLSTQIEGAVGGLADSGPRHAVAS